MVDEQVHARTVTSRSITVAIAVLFHEEADYNWYHPCGRFPGFPSTVGHVEQTAPRRSDCRVCPGRLLESRESFYLAEAEQLHGFLRAFI